MTNEYERYDFWNRELKKQREDLIEYNAESDTDFEIDSESDLIVKPQSELNNFD